MRKAQFSIIDLILTMMAVSVSSTFLLMINSDYSELSLRYKNYYDKNLILTLFNYDTITTEVSEYLCTGEHDPLERIINITDTLNEKEEYFIMFIENKSWMPSNISERLTNKGILFYNNKTSVCLDNVNLIKINFMTNCGEVIINYGSWMKGEETC